MNPAQKFLKQIPQYTRMGRHARSVIEHGDLRKWGNLARVEMERKLRRIEVKSHPYLLFLDPCNYCNLRCPLCPTGMKELGREQSMMSFDCFKRYIDPHLPYLFEVILHNWGESMINKDLFRMVEYAQANNVGTNLSSNLNITRSDDLDSLIDSGLEFLALSVDGADQESYEKYRVRGRFDQVMENAAELVRRRDLRKQKTPFIEWQYIVMKHNQHKVEDAEILAKKIGVDRIRFIPVGLPFESKTSERERLAKQWFPTELEGRHASDYVPQTFGQTDKPSPCYYLYRSMVINADGGVSPCCIVYDQKRDFDDLATKESIEIMQIWNNDKFRSARSLYSSKELTNRPGTVCDGCDIFAKHPSKTRKKSRLSGIQVISK